MQTSEELYPNIVKFLKNNGLKIFKINERKVIVDFISTEVSESVQTFEHLRDEADNTTDSQKSEMLYDQAWEILNNTNQKFFPKLQPILDALDSFYENRNTPLEFKIFFRCRHINLIVLEGNALYLDMYPDKEFFNSQIKKELDDFDNFLI